MSIHHSRLLAPLLLVVTLGAYGCEDNGRTDERVDRIGPTPISFRGFGESPVNSTDFFARGVTLQPTFITPQRIVGAACPGRPPFLAPVRILAGGDGASDVFLSQVQMRFADRTGIIGGAMTLEQRHLIDLFGSTRIPARSRRSFPFSFPFGCFGGSAGTLTVVVFTGDSTGREMSTSLSVGIH